MIVQTTSEAVFACHEASCRPPTSGGTGGSGGGLKSASRMRTGQFYLDKEHGSVKIESVTPREGKPYDTVKLSKADGTTVTVFVGSGGMKGRQAPEEGSQRRSRPTGSDDGYDARKDARRESGLDGSRVDRGRYPTSARKMYRGKGNFG